MLCYVIISILYPFVHLFLSSLVVLFLFVVPPYLTPSHLIPIHSSTHPLIHSFTHSFAHSFIHLLIHSFIHSFAHSFICSFICSFSHSFIHLFIHLLICSFILSYICSFIHLFSHSFIYFLIHSFIPLFIHSFIFHSLIHSIILKCIVYFRQPMNTYLFFLLDVSKIFFLLNLSKMSLIYLKCYIINFLILSLWSFPFRYNVIDYYKLTLFLVTPPFLVLVLLIFLPLFNQTYTLSTLQLPAEKSAFRIKPVTYITVSVSMALLLFTFLTYLCLRYVQAFD